MASRIHPLPPRVRLCLEILEDRLAAGNLLPYLSSFVDSAPPPRVCTVTFESTVQP
jgi:hypothetical protein